jgi:hypothetical protein
VNRAPDRIADVWRRIVLAVATSALALTLTSCRVDVTVDVAMIQNGSGTMTVTVDADPQVVAQAPGLAGDLRLDDLTAAGWTTDGPVGTPDGGLSIVLTHPFDTPEQATALLASLNGPDGPFRAVSFAREATDRSIEYRVSGSASVDGLNGFTDSDLSTAVGGTPYADTLDAQGVPAAEAVGLTFSVSLPGIVDESTAGRDQPFVWQLPADDSVVDLTTSTSASLQSGRNWTVLATLSFVALGLWVMIGLVFVVFVARRQHLRRSRRRSLAALADLEVRDDLI